MIISSQSMYCFGRDNYVFDNKNSELIFNIFEIYSTSCTCYLVKHPDKIRRREKVKEIGDVQLTIKNRFFNSDQIG